MADCGVSLDAQEGILLHSGRLGHCVSQPRRGAQLPPARVVLAPGTLGCVQHHPLGRKAGGMRYPSAVGIVPVLLLPLHIQHCPQHYPRLRAGGAAALLGERGRWGAGCVRSNVTRGRARRLWRPDAVGGKAGPRTHAVMGSGAHLVSILRHDLRHDPHRARISHTTRLLSQRMMRYATTRARTTRAGGSWAPRHNVAAGGATHRAGLRHVTTHHVRPEPHTRVWWDVKRASAATPASCTSLGYVMPPLLCETEAILKP